MFNNKKGISLLVLIIVAVIVLGAVYIVVVMNRDNSSENISPVSDAQLDESTSVSDKHSDDSTSEETKPVEKVQNKLISGAEYYAPERDIDGVTSNRFSFFIGNDRKILTYINEDKETKIKMVSHNFRENSVSVAFQVNKISVVVSDNNYYLDGESLNYANKNLVAEENGMKYYTAPYKNGYYVHYFETIIDGIPVSFYATNKSAKNDALFTGVQELASKLSVNDKVGLWADWELSNNYARNGIALKSAKLFSLLNTDKDKIMIGDYEVSVMFSVYSWKSTDVDKANVVMGEIAGQKYGYYTVKDSSGNTNVRVHIYKSEIFGGAERYTNEPTIFLMDKLNETNLTAEQFATMVMEQLIEYQE